jgi:hypothetical protein
VGSSAERNFCLETTCRKIQISLIGTESDDRYHGTAEACWEKRMANHAVALRVTPFLRIECKFWLTDDGWNGSCEQFSIEVQAGTFEFVKSEMEIALGKHLESLLNKSRRPSAEQAA